MTEILTDEQLALLDRARLLGRNINGSVSVETGAFSKLADIIDALRARCEQAERERDSNALGKVWFDPGAQVWVADCPAAQVISQAETREEAWAAVAEAVRLRFEAKDGIMVQLRQERDTALAQIADANVQVEQLREALVRVRDLHRIQNYWEALGVANNALSTPPSDWLAEHDRQVAERCAGIVESCKMDGPAPIGPLFGAGWDEAILVAALAIRRQVGAQPEPPSAGVSSSNSGQAESEERRERAVSNRTMSPMPDYQTCSDCGRADTPCWHIDDETYIAVMGRKDGDTPCLECFDCRARAMALHPVYRVTATNVPWRWSYEDDQHRLSWIIGVFNDPALSAEDIIDHLLPIIAGGRVGGNVYSNPYSAIDAAMKEQRAEAMRVLDELEQAAINKETEPEEGAHSERDTDG